MIKANAWTQWGSLKTIVVGRADKACFQVEEPAFKGRINNKSIAKELDWPRGPKKQSVIDKANEQLDHLANVFKGLGINVLRPTPIDFNKKITTPEWSIDQMFCCVCPRDVMITIGNIILEATLSRRGRFFEYLPYRPIMNQLWDQDSSMKWKAAPKPTMNDSMYRADYWDKFKDLPQKSPDEQKALLKEYYYVLDESEIAFDAADITRCGRDIFVQYSMTTNLKAIEWLKRELEGYVRVHMLHFPDAIEPIHIDTTFVPLRPPRNGKPGIILTNPERSLRKEDEKIFVDNNWKLVDVPPPNTINYSMPSFCESSKWLSMNLLSIDEETLVVEENEKELHLFLEDLGFKLIKVPFRYVYEFGGSIHCSTWDIERNDGPEEFFKIGE